MKRIYLYELKRLLWNKFFIGLLLVTLFYGGQVLQNETLLGVADTAPFSPWSFGAYLGRMLPLLWVGALFFLTFFTGAAQKRVAALTDATPAPPRRYDLARLAAAATGAALLSLAAVAAALFFYARMFAWYGWGALLTPALLALVPPLALALGGGIYLLDEPFAGVDPARQTRLMAALKELEAPVLLISHEDAALRLAHHVLSFSGPPLTLLPPPAPEG